MKNAPQRFYIKTLRCNGATFYKVWGYVNDRRTVKRVFGERNKCELFTKSLLDDGYKFAGDES